jgi:hypothetical protein
MSKRRLLVPAIVFAVFASLILRAAARDPSDVRVRPCEAGAPCPPGSPSATASPSPSRDPVIVAAGDIAAKVPSAATKATARLVTAIDPTVVLALGDNEYPAGSLHDYKTGYDPTWGAFLSKTRPTLGNHEYETDPTAAGYFDYFGQRSPDNYYSFDVGTWHLISLDSNCSMNGGCVRGTSQYEWLRADLSAHPALCTLAYWHHPRWSSGTETGNDNHVAPLVKLLYETGADVILTGHEHNYERFAPQAPDGTGESMGIVEFVVGTGGRSLTELGRPDANSVVRNDTSFGVLQMTLHEGSYDFVFKSVLGSTFRDSGSASCH